MSQRVDIRPLVAPYRSSQQEQERGRVWPVNVNKSLLLVRVVVGLLFVGHGLQKLLGWFGGPGISGWIGSVQKAGLEPAALWAYLEGFAELGGGLLLALGLLTPLAAAVLIGDMLVAILKVHAARGLWSQSGGYEYNLVLIALLLAVGLVGPGLFSFDRRLPFALPRPHVFAVSMVLTLGMVGFALYPSLR
jgi:putative oxidoreductase